MYNVWGEALPHQKTLCCTWASRISGLHCLWFWCFDVWCSPVRWPLPTFHEVTENLRSLVGKLVLCLRLLRLNNWLEVNKKVKIHWKMLTTVRPDTNEEDAFFSRCFVFKLWEVTISGNDFLNRLVELDKLKQLSRKQERKETVRNEAAWGCWCAPIDC